MYFPRSKTEEQWAMDLLPANVGNEDGEPVNPERKIRITQDPINKDLGRLPAETARPSSVQP